MIKILYVISDSNVGGAGVQLCSLLRHLDKSRFQCAVAMPRGSVLMERPEMQQTEVIPLAHPCDRFSRASVRELRDVIQRVQPRVVHANAALCARVAGKMSGCSLIHTRHCYYPAASPRVGIFRGLGHLANRWLTDLAIATAPSAAENLEELGIPRQLVRVILNGSDPIREVEEDELQSFRQRFEIDAEEICIGICARLESCKGHETFLRAASLLSNRLPTLPLRFLIVGEGSLRGELERYSASLGLSRKVVFTGFVEDMAPVYRLLRVNVNCSCGTETSCLAISEGMSAALPTVVSDYGWNAMMVEGGGLCYPVGKAEALAEQLCRILTDPVLEKELGRRSLERYKCCFTAKRMARETEALYDLLAGGRRAFP